jgi:hypothetical protein
MSQVKKLSQPRSFESWTSRRLVERLEIHGSNGEKGLNNRVYQITMA